MYAAWIAITIIDTNRIVIMLIIIANKLKFTISPHE